jgi:hypothetical protein
MVAPHPIDPGLCEKKRVDQALSGAMVEAWSSVKFTTVE